MNISALIPAYNEADLIGATITALQETGIFNQILVVNDGSTDNTEGIAKESGAAVLSLDTNQGKGAALNHGINWVTGDVICLIDGDLGSSASEAEKLVRPILAGKAQMVIARFPKSKDKTGSVKAGFGLVKGLAKRGIKTYTGQQLTEPLSGQRAMTKEVMHSLLPFHSGYGVEVFLTIKALKHGFVVLEVDTMMTHRHTGADLKGFWHRGRQFIHVAQALLRVGRIRV